MEQVEETVDTILETEIWNGKTLLDVLTLDFLISTMAFLAGW